MSVMRRSKVTPKPVSLMVKADNDNKEPIIEMTPIMADVSGGDEPAKKKRKMEPSPMGKRQMNIVGSDGTAKPKVKREKRGKKPKDPNEPKKNVGPFIWFGNEMRDEIKLENPEAKFGDIGKELGKRWQSLSEGQKRKYKEMADADKARYDAQIEIYRKTYH